MNKIDIAKQVIEGSLQDASCGLFNTPDCVGDEKEVLFNGNGVLILICRYWEYFEVFGLTQTEFNKLHEWYTDKVENRRIRTL